MSLSFSIVRMVPVLDAFHVSIVLYSPLFFFCSSILIFSDIELLERSVAEDVEFTPEISNVQLLLEMF